MRTLHLLVSLAAAALPAFAQTPAAQPLLHLSASFDFVVHAPFAKTAPLFGGEAERLWAGGHWNPQFIHPQPARDVEGAVFTIQHGDRKAVWVNTVFDLDAGRFQYVYFMPDLMVTVIDVRLLRDGAESTRVIVVYTRTALTSEGNEHVSSMNEADKSSGREWEQAINRYFSGLEIGSRP
jgi:hypothetical protein